MIFKNCFHMDIMKTNSDKLRLDCHNLIKNLQTTNEYLIESINKNKKKSFIKDQSKTVTFSDYLRTTFEDSPKRRSRSVSSDPRLTLNKNFKSILKKTSNNSINSSYSDINESRLSNDKPISAAPSLSDVFAELDIQDDFDEKIKYIIKYHDLSNERKYINQKSLVDYINKKRQKYLSNDYDDIKQSPNSLKKPNKKIKKQLVKKPLRSKSADCILGNSFEKDKIVKSNKRSKNSNYKKLAKKAVNNKPLLGFDWALGILYFFKNKHYFIFNFR